MALRPRRLYIKTYLKYSGGTVARFTGERYSINTAECGPDFWHRDALDQTIADRSITGLTDVQIWAWFLDQQAYADLDFVFEPTMFFANKTAIMAWFNAHLDRRPYYVTYLILSSGEHCFTFRVLDAITGLPPEDQAPEPPPEPSPVPPGDLVSMITAEFYEHIVKPISDYLASQISWVKNQVINTLKPLLDPINSWLFGPQGVITKIQASISGVQGWINSAVSSISSQIGTKIDYVKIWIGEGAMSAYNLLAGWISSNITPAISELKTLIKDPGAAVKPFFDKLWSDLTTWYSSNIKPWIDNASKAISDKVDATKAALDGTKKALEDFAANTTASLSIFDGPDFGAMLQEVAGGLPTFQAGFWLQRKSWFDSIFPGMDLEKELAKFAETKLMGDLRKKALDPLTNLLQIPQVIPPGKENEVYTKLVLDFATVAFQAAIAGVAVRAVMPELGETADKIHDNVVAMFGLHMVLKEMVLTPYNPSIFRPLGYHFDNIFRTKRPNSAEAFMAYRTREFVSDAQFESYESGSLSLDELEAINLTNFAEEMHHNGYQDKYIEMLSKAATWTPNFSNLMQIARRGIYDEGEFTYSLFGAGYDKRTISRMLEVLKSIATESTYGGFRALVEPAYRDGFISEDDLRTYYSKINVPLDVQDWAIIRLRKLREDKLSRDTTEKITIAAPVASAWRNLYKEGWISGGELRGSLNSLIEQKDPVELNLLQAQLQYEYDRLQELKAAYIDAFVKGQIPEDQLRQALSSLGLEPVRLEDAVFIAGVKKTGKVPIVAETTTKRLSASTILRAYKAGEISEPEARARLAEIGYDETDIIVQLALYRPAAPEGE